MSLFKKIMGMLAGASPVERAVGSCLGHFLEGNTPAAIGDLLTMVEVESNSHPAVKAEVAKIRTALTTVGLASPQAVPAPPASPPAAPTPPVATPVPPAAPAAAVAGS